MVCRRLLPRVINFKLAPTRRLGMTEMKRHNLVKKMLQTLIIEERLKTTNGKAKFIKFYADRLIELAQSGTPEAYQQASKLVDKPDQVMPKLFGRMTARYNGHEDEKTRILLNGQRDYRKSTQGPMAYPDAAEMAILEFSDAPRSISFLLAKHGFEKVRDRLAEIEGELYDRSKVNLIDPTSKASVNVIKLKEKPMKLHQKLLLKIKERNLRNTLAHCDYRLTHTIACFKKEFAYLERELPNVQEKVNQMKQSNQELTADFIKSMEITGFSVAEQTVEIIQPILTLQEEIEVLEQQSKQIYITEGVFDEKELPVLESAQASHMSSESTQSSTFSSFFNKLKGWATEKKK